MSTGSTCDISIVLPCFREEESVESGLEKILEVMKETRYTFEIVFVDDASTDGTPEKIRKAAEGKSNVSYLFQKENAGRGGAFVAGATRAKGTIIGYVDVDLEISISSLPQVIEEIKNGNDVVIVKRNYKTGFFSARHLASSVYKKIVQRILRMPALDTETGFKFFRREALFSLLKETESKRWFFDTEIMCLAYYRGMQIAQVDGIYTKNRKKVSTVNLLSDSLKQFGKVLSYRRKIAERFWNK